MVLDRAGLVGNDGATHHGSFDLAYMACVPDIIIMAPADEGKYTYVYIFILTSTTHAYTESISLTPSLDILLLAIMASANEVELQNMVETLYKIDNRPSVVRFPRYTNIYHVISYHAMSITALTNCNQTTPHKTTTSTTTLTPPFLTPMILPLIRGSFICMVVCLFVLQGFWIWL